MTTRRLLTQLRAEIKTRDQFLSKLAGTLSQSALGLERAVRAGPKLPAAVLPPLRELVSLVRELQIIAAPDEPLRPRLRKRELCGFLARFCAERQQRYGLQISFERAGAIRCRIDEDLLATMLDELLSNAIKYRRKRPVSLHAAMSGKSVVITVSNRGPWVGPKAQFKRFQRGEARRSVLGFGVGLWLTRRLSEAHGGTLRIETRPTHTCTIITLPAASRVQKPAWFRASVG